MIMILNFNCFVVPSIADIHLSYVITLNQLLSYIYFRRRRLSAHELLLIYM